MQHQHRECPNRHTTISCVNGRCTEIDNADTSTLATCWTSSATAVKAGLSRAAMVEKAFAFKQD